MRDFLNAQEVDLLKEALETSDPTNPPARAGPSALAHARLLFWGNRDQSLVDQEIQLADENEGQTKLALWSNPGDGTLGSLSRSRRVVETVEGMLGGPVRL